MGYTSFISYNTNPEEQVVVYRLQTLASASGITVLLPQRNSNVISNETKQRIDLADSIIAFLTSNISAQVREEIAYAQGRNKLIIPIHEKGARVGDLKDLDWIQYDPGKDTPGSIEKQVINLLKKQKVEKENREAVLIAVLGIGLLALLASAK